MSISRQSLDWIELVQKSWKVTATTLTVLFALLTNESFSVFHLFPWWSDEINNVLNHIMLGIVVFLLIAIVRGGYDCLRSRVLIKGKDYRIQVEYGDLFDCTDGWIVIPFDSYFTTTVGSKPEDINEDSVCGQFLKEHPMTDGDIKDLIDARNPKLVPLESSLRKKPEYESGRLLSYAEKYFLLAFAKLDEKGRGCLSLDQYLKSLMVFWEETDLCCKQKDVWIPILGSGTTRIEGRHLSAQECLDYLVLSYRLSSHRMCSTLHIVCRRSEDFSLNKIGTILRAKIS